MKFAMAYRVRRMFSIRLLVCLFLIAGNHLPAHAQDDTTAVPDEEIDTISSEEYVPEPVTMREVPDSVARNLKRDKNFEYANDMEYWKAREKPKQQRTPSKKPTTSNQGTPDYNNGFLAFRSVRFFLYILLGLLLLFIIYRIAMVNNLYISRRNRKLIDDTEGQVEDIESIDPDEKIKKAIAENNHRLAVRYLYLKALQLLNDKGWIKFHAQATNLEYVNQMSKYSVVSEFRFLTDVYDYVWYGEFALTPEQFELVYNNFKNFYQAIK